MKVLLVGLLEGFTARDDITARLLSESSLVTELLVLTGNAATARLPKTRHILCPDGGKWELATIVETACRERVDLVVIGAEVPLSAGLVDLLNQVGIPAFGPSQIAAQLEARKSFAIKLMREALIPHPRSWIFSEQQKALEFVLKHSGPIVVKLDGLARGKGVWVCKTRGKAVDAVRACMESHPGETLVFQEMRKGVEVSAFCFTDGENISELVAACDYKPRRRKDKGPNTGSMGSFSPPTFWTDKLAETIRATILQPIVDAMRRRGILYRGVIYAGLMLTASGVEVLEFNCRFGDAEAQVILPLLKTDLLKIMLACIEGSLDQIPVEWDRQRVVGTVVLVDKNYPESVSNNGGCIDGLDLVGEGVIVFHYATKLDGSGRVVLGGSGRRLSVTAVGATHEEVFRNIYRAIRRISFPGKAWRDDIGKGRDLSQKLRQIYM